MSDSWITKAIAKQRRDVPDIPKYVLDAYEGKGRPLTSVAQNEPAQRGSWIETAIAKQRRDVKDIPQYVLDAYNGIYSPMPEATTSSIADVSGGGRNTRIEYMYRDGANYKTSAHVVLAGRLDPSLVPAIEANLADGQYFIAGQVGLTDLQDSFAGCASEWNPEHDHPYHELLAIRYTEEDATADLSSDVFAKRMSEAKWDDSYRPPFYDTMTERYNERVAMEMR